MAAPDFSVTIIFESREAGKRAKRFSDQFIAEAAVDGAIQLNLWNFGVLGIREIRNAAASAAATSDLVILSMSGTGPLPRQAVEWIEMWIWLLDGRQPAVVALFGAPKTGWAATQSYLRQRTRSKKLDFLPIMPHVASDPNQEEDFFTRQRPEANGAGTSSRWDSHALLSFSKAHSPLHSSNRELGSNRFFV